MLKTAQELKFMDNILVNNRDHFFGACNSFHGFKSFFGEIFKRKDFTRIYVIKGGPGTGKSSFMKKILHKHNFYVIFPFLTVEKR